MGLALALVAAEADDAVDLGDDRVILGLESLEQLGDAWQTTGGALGLDRLARNAGDDVAGLDSVAFGDADVGADEQKVPHFLVGVRQLPGLAAVVLDGDARLGVGIAQLDDDYGLPTIVTIMRVEDAALLPVAGGSINRAARSPWRLAIQSLRLDVALGLIPAVDKKAPVIRTHL